MDSSEIEKIITDIAVRARNTKKKDLGYVFLITGINRGLSSMGVTEAAGLRTQLWPPSAEACIVAVTRRRSVK